MNEAKSDDLRNETLLHLPNRITNLACQERFQYSFPASDTTSQPSIFMPWPDLASLTI